MIDPWVTSNARARSSPLVARDLPLDWDRGWQPSPEVVQHNGLPIPDSMFFPLEPPPEIGQVISAHSTLKPGTQPSALGSWFRFISLISLLPTALVFACSLTSKQYGNDDTVFITFLGFVFVGIPCAIVASYLITFAGCVTFVGTHGAARVFLPSTFEMPRVQSLVYADALFLETQVQAQTGIYATAYHWKDAQEKTLLRTVSIATILEESKSQERFFGEKIAALWTHHFVDQMREQLQRRQPVTFRVNRRDQINVGLGTPEIVRRGKTYSLSRDDIDWLTLRNFWLMIKCKNANLLTLKGWFFFRTSKIRNVPLLAFCLENYLAFPPDETCS